MNREKTGHQKRIEKFMRLAEQDVPCEPTEPPPEVRLLGSGASGSATNATMVAPSCCARAMLMVMALSVRSEP
jgi:hypothetical protein